MVYDAFVFTCRQHVSHASLIHIESTQLLYLALISLTLVEFEMLGGGFDMLLESFALLGLRWLLLVNRVASRHQPVMLMFFGLDLCRHHLLLRLVA